MAETGSNLSHTPAPWDVVPWFDGKAIIVVKGDDGGVRLVIGKVEDVPGSPDANLLKTAPKLLAALKACRDEMIRANADIQNMPGGWDTIDRATEAINEAEGKGAPPCSS